MFYFSNVSSYATQFGYSHIFDIYESDFTLKLTHKEVVRIKLNNTRGVTVGAKTLEFDEVFGRYHVNFVLHTTYENKRFTLMSDSGTI